MSKIDSPLFAALVAAATTAASSHRHRKVDDDTKGDKLELLSLTTPEMGWSFIEEMDRMMQGSKGHNPRRACT